MRKTFLLSTFVLAICTSLVPASNADAEKRLEDAVNEVLAVANRSAHGSAMVENLRPVLDKHLSFEVMTRRAVGPGWRQFSKAEREEATRLFSTLIIRTYSEKLVPGEKPVIHLQPAVAPASGRVDVPTTLRYQGSDYDVTYRMEKAESWRITDVVVEGVSLVANYRSQFDALFKRGGANEVINSLTQSVARSQ